MLDTESAKKNHSVMNIQNCLFVLYLFFLFSVEDVHNKTLLNEVAHNYWWPSSLHNSPTKNKNVNKD